MYEDFNVTELIAIGLPVSARLGFIAMLVALLLGGTCGIVAALRHNRLFDHATMTMAMTGIAIPSFVTAPILALFFGLYLKLLPVAGWNDGAAANMVLPVIALALPQLAIIARLMRGGMLEVLRANFVRTARSKGLPERQVVINHVLQSAAVPLVGYLGPALAGIMTGSLVIELIFDLPGVGRYFIQGALNRDYPLVMGIVIVYGTLIILLNLLSDLAYAALTRGCGGPTGERRRAAAIADAAPRGGRRAVRLALAPGRAAFPAQSRRDWQHRRAARHCARFRADPGILPHAVEDASWENILLPPSFENWHWFGTDANGRDQFVRVFYGGRISLTIGLMTTLVALGIGVGYGAIAGFTGGRSGRLHDALCRHPVLAAAVVPSSIILVTVFGRNIFLIFVAIGAVEWLTLSRIVRGQTLSVKAKEYVESAVAIGLSKPAILRRYIIPKRGRSGGRLRDAPYSHQHPHRELPELHRAGRPGTAHKLGPADLAGGRPARHGPLADPVPGHSAGDHDVLLQFHRRRAARRASTPAPGNESAA